MCWHCDIPVGIQHGKHLRLVLTHENAVCVSCRGSLSTPLASVGCVSTAGQRQVVQEGVASAVLPESSPSAAARGFDACTSAHRRCRRSLMLYACSCTGAWTQQARQLALQGKPRHTDHWCQLTADRILCRVWLSPPWRLGCLAWPTRSHLRLWRRQMPA